MDIRLSRRLFVVAIAALGLCSNQSAQAGTVSAWAAPGGSPIVNDDTSYGFISASSELDPTLVNAGGSTPVWHILNSNLNALDAPTTLEFSITVTNPSVAIDLIRVSENDTLGNVFGGSTTNVYSDAGFTNLLASFTLLQTQPGSDSAAAFGLQTIYVQENVTGVDSGFNNIQSINFDVTQTAATPEPATMISLAMGLGAAGFVTLRRRRAAKA